MLACMAARYLHVLPGPLGAVLLLSTLFAGWLPGMNEVQDRPPTRYPRTDCAGARARLEAARQRGRYHERFVLETGAYTLRWRCAGEGTLACGDLWFPLVSAPTCDTSGRAMGSTAGQNALLLQPVPPGRFAILEICDGCRVIPAEQPAHIRVGAAVVKGFLVALGGLGLALILNGLGLIGATAGAGRSRPSPRRLIRELPRAVVPVATVNPDELQLEPLDRGDPVPLAELLAAAGQRACIKLDAGTGFRQAPACLVLVGPGRVNGLMVPSGVAAPIDHGDVVRIAGRRLRVCLKRRVLPLRYHRGESDRLRFYRMQPLSRRRRLGLQALPIAVTILSGIPVVLSRAAAPVHAAIALLMLVASWALLPRLSVRLQSSELALKGNELIDGQERLGDLRVERDDDGYRLLGRRWDGKEAVVEEVRGAVGAEERALLEALRFEVELICDRQV
jgi:hypothetical protein